MVSYWQNLRVTFTSHLRGLIGILRGAARSVARLGARGDGRVLMLGSNGDDILWAFSRV